jgi:hypothetical protein
MVGAALTGSRVSSSRFDRPPPPPSFEVNYTSFFFSCVLGQDISKSKALQGMRWRRPGDGRG